MPRALYGLGRRELVAGLEPERAVTIVGSRRPSAYGRAVTRRLARETASAGLVVVSGMALGCDAIAHAGALEAGGDTVAVLGSGPDVVYPRSHRSLHARISSVGAVVSEHPPRTAATKWSFPVRNRIMAALAQVTVVVEGQEASGTAITADLVARSSQMLAAVPGPVNSSLSALPNALLKDGAHLVRDAQDVLDLALGPGRTSVRGHGPALEPALAGALRALEGGARTCDAIAVELGVEGRQAAVAVARLELMGYVRVDTLGGLARTALVPPEGPPPGARAPAGPGRAPD